MKKNIDMKKFGILKLHQKKTDFLHFKKTYRRSDNWSNISADNEHELKELCKRKKYLFTKFKSQIINMRWKELQLHNYILQRNYLRILFSNKKLNLYKQVIWKQ